MTDKRYEVLVNNDLEISLKEEFKERFGEMGWLK